MAVFEVEAYRVWRGSVKAEETIIVSLPRMLLLGDEYVLATSRSDKGFFEITNCTPVVFPHRDPEWVEMLGDPVQQYSPSIFKP